MNLMMQQTSIITGKNKNQGLGDRSSIPIFLKQYKNVKQRLKTCHSISNFQEIFMEKIPVEKNKEYIVEIIDNGFEGEGIAKIDNFTIFINGAIKGEKVKILIVKVLSSHAFGKIVEILEKSDKRQE